MYARCTVNGSTELVGSVRLQQVGTDVLNAIFFANLTANDYISLEVLRVGGTTGTAVVPIVVTLMYLKGATGTQGVTGPSYGPQGITGLQGTTGFALTVFGNSYTYAESEAVSTTTSNVYQQKLRLTTPSLSAGTYRIAWQYLWYYGSTSTNFYCQVQIDDTTTIYEQVEEPKDTATTQRQPSCGFKTTALTSGVHNIDLDYRSGANGTTSGILLARMDIFRVN